MKNFKGEEGYRLDKFLCEKFPDYSRSFIQKIIRSEEVTVNGKPFKQGGILSAGDEITVDINAPEPLQITAEDIPVDIIYEDSDILVINKPQGMVTHPANGNYTGTLVNALIGRCELSAINGIIRPGIVHRLDKNTSGLLLVAKSNRAHIRLSEALKNRQITRKYVAVLNGELKDRDIKIDLPIGRHPVDRKKMAVNHNGKPAITYMEVIGRAKNYTYVLCSLLTGRTHQIRVHASYIGHCIVGDREYGIKDGFKLKGQLLVAKILEFKHPITMRDMHFEIDLPLYFSDMLDKLNIV